MKWEPIRPFEYSGELQGTSELESLKVVWAFYQELYGPDVTASLRTRFNREWSIETGQIEGAYDLDRGVTETLLDQGFKESLISRQRNGKSAEQVASILRDQMEALEGLFDFVKTQELSLSYIKELHQQLMRSEPTYTVYSPEGIPFETPLEKGMYKREPNNPSRPAGEKHEYCPPEHTAREMERLVEIYNEQRELPTEVQAAWLHHAFTQIHPFQDGNGRVARALASLVLIKAGLFPIVVFREDRGRYIGCLEVADGGELAGLIEFFRRSQRQAILQVSEGLDWTRKKWADSETVEDIFGTIKTDLTHRGELQREEWLETERRIRLTNDWISVDFERVKVSAFNSLGEGFRFQVTSGHVQFEHNYKVEIPDGRASYIILKDAKLAVLQLIPRRFRGLAIRSFVYVDSSKKAVPVGDDFFINWAEDIVKLTRRFELWMEANITEGLKLWRKDFIG